MDTDTHRHEAPRWPVLGITVMLVLLVIASLAAAVLGGLLRAGVAWPVLPAAWPLGQAAARHAALMLPGWLGMVISIERAVAVRERWAWSAPLAAGLGNVAWLAGLGGPGAWLNVAAAGLSLAVHLVVLRRQPAAHTRLLVLACIAWLTGSLLWTRGLPSAVPWWFLLPVLTIAAERLEMTRLTRRHALAPALLLVCVALLVVGAALGAMPGTVVPGGVLYGLGLIALSLWLFTFDIARRTLFTQGLARYMAVSLLAGYAWLALAGLGWMGLALGCPGRDLALHALGLGFIFSMVMGHAPVIFPAVARLKLHFGGWFYLPLAALHGSLALRLFGGIGDPAVRALGAQLNAASVGLFLLTLAGSALAWRLRQGRSGEQGRKGRKARSLRV